MHFNIRHLVIAWLSTMYDTRNTKIKKKKKLLNFTFFPNHLDWKISLYFSVEEFGEGKGIRGEICGTSTGCAKCGPKFVPTRTYYEKKNYFFISEIGL